MIETWRVVARVGDIRPNDVIAVAVDGVEIVVGRQTDAEVVRRAVRFVQQLGKLPVVVQDSPGFLVNRILMPYLIEAGRLFESGARIEDIDQTMLDFGNEILGHPMTPRIERHDCVRPHPLAVRADLDERSRVFQVGAGVRIQRSG